MVFDVWNVETEKKLGTITARDFDEAKSSFLSFVSKMPRGGTLIMTKVAKRMPRTCYGKFYMPRSM